MQRVLPKIRKTGSGAYPHSPFAQAGRRHVYVYDVVFDGETIVTGSPDPEPDLARALLARGITGTITVFEGKKPRTIVNIEGAAKIRTSEPCDRRSRFVRHAEAGHGRPCHL